MNELEPIKSVQPTEHLPTTKEAEEFTPMVKGGKSFMLSRREQTVADEFIKTQSIDAAYEALRPLGWTMPCKTAVKGWLKRPHVATYIVERSEEMGILNGYTPGSFMLEILKLARGKGKIDPGRVHLYELVGKVLGIQEGKQAQNTNVQINLTQANGRD